MSYTEFVDIPTNTKLKQTGLKEVPFKPISNPEKGRSKMKKYDRHNKILEIIGEYNVQTQEDLIARLKEAGFTTTQATISRDIRELKLVKVSAEDGNYKYAVSNHEEIKISAKYVNIIRDTVTSVDYANNFVVLKTYSGMAQAAAAAVDGMNWNEIVGCIAGDDNIFVLMRDVEASIELVGKFRKILKLSD